MRPLSAGIVSSNPVGSMDDYLVSVVGCAGTVPCVVLITHSEESYPINVSECDREASIMRRPWPQGIVAPWKIKSVICGDLTTLSV